MRSVHSRFGLHGRQVAQGDPLHRRLRRLRYLHHRSDCYRPERPVAGWDSHPLEIAAFSRRTLTRSLPEPPCPISPSAPLTPSSLPPPTGSFSTRSCPASASESSRVAASPTSS